MDSNKPLVGVVMGSASDADVMKGCVEVLKEMGIPHEVKILSAHRTPEQTREYAATASERGIQVIIAGAGSAAHLAGAIAAQTTLPVIGIPIDSSPLKGMDALLSTVQMPSGIPVATVALGKGGGKNAAVLASQILGLKDAVIAQEVVRYRKALTQAASERIDSWDQPNR
ncbi:MAG TPA: 5-(carboxyamino)imidazole ribonucleotide mutase [Desulfobacteria bacterium]|nr:5-(carboxyamino)imidazole ribonucleotide mutase [Desulfobacteria bacterium]